MLHLQRLVRRQRLLRQRVPAQHKQRHPRVRVPVLQQVRVQRQLDKRRFKLWQIHIFLVYKVQKDDWIRIWIRYQLRHKMVIFILIHLITHGEFGLMASGGHGLLQPQLQPVPVLQRLVPVLQRPVQVVQQVLVLQLQQVLQPQQLYS